MIASALLFTIASVVVNQSGVLAVEPTCAALLCNKADHTEKWIAGAQEEAIVLLQTLFGGFTLANNALVHGIHDNVDILSASMCLDRQKWHKGKVCHTKYCDFWKHKELFFDGPVQCGNCTKHFADSHGLSHVHGSKHVPFKGRPKKDGHVCRSVSEWIAIGQHKLYDAYSLREQSQFENATSAACVAERLLRLVNDRFESVFARERASYRHIVSKSYVSAFDLAASDGDANDLMVATRVVQSFRKARGAEGSHQLIATYVLARVVERSTEDAEAEESTGGVTQLLWPISGVILPFDKSSVPAGNECSRLSIPTTIDPVFDPERALDRIGPLDFAVVNDGFLRCGSLPTSGQVRHYRDLTPGGCCGTVTLFADIDAEATNTRHEPVRASFGYVAHRNSPVHFEADEERELNVQDTLIARVAASDVCEDFEPSVVAPEETEESDDSEDNSESENDDDSDQNNQEDENAENDDEAVETPAELGLFGETAQSTYKSPLEGIPVTLAPGQSQCVGGTNAGKYCDTPSECGAGLACKSVPGTLESYCHSSDSGFDKTRPCISADSRDQCPYGECYGDVNGHEGGAYPLLHFWRANKCSFGKESANPVCNDENVRHWYAHPNPGTTKA